MMNKLNRRSAAGRNRKGAAVVEFAVCLPVILLIVLGSIQAASLMFLRQALIQSAYEGAKIAVRFDGTNPAAINAMQNVANGRRIKSPSFSLSDDVTTVDRGTPIVVTVTAPGDLNSFIPFGPFAGQTIQAQAVMVKE
jgi:Flp pilus assembly protein TadG